MRSRNRIGRTRPTGGAPLGRLALVAALIVVPPGAVAGEGPSSAQEAAPPEAKAASEAEPEFKPGIPGLKMVDVRDHKLLWREIEQLQIWESGDRISIAEYRAKVIEKTAHFLGLRGNAADKFARAASEAVAALREAVRKKRQAGGGASAVEDQFQADVRVAVTRVSALLKTEPRHQLFEPDCKKWLYKLALGPKEAKEAREAKQAQAKKYLQGVSP